MITFSTFLKRHTTAPDRGFVGDLASEVKADKDFPRQATFQKVYRYLSDFGVDYRRMDALYNAYKEYCMIHNLKPNFRGTEWKE